MHQEVVPKCRYLRPEEKYQIILEPTMAMAKGNAVRSVKHFGAEGSIPAT